MDPRKKKKLINQNVAEKMDQLQKDADFILFLAEQEDIRDSRGECESHGSIFKTMVESRPADEECPEETWDAYVSVDGHFFYASTFITKDEALKYSASLRLQLEKMAKSMVSDIMSGKKF